MQKYCIQPFNNIRVELLESPDNIPRYKPCCHYVFKNEYITVESYLNSEELAQLQQHLLTQDKLPSDCGFCANAELHNNQTSTRLLHSKHVKPMHSTKIEHLELSPGNICNLKCLMCNANDSSALGAEQVRLGWIPSNVITEQDDRVLEILSQFDTLKSVSIIGGEFFLAKKNLTILDLVAQKQIQLKVTTNATVLTKAHLEKLQMIPNVEITLSIDGTGAVYEYIRYPADWSTVAENVGILKKLLPKSLSINSVIQPLNIQHIDGIINFANQNIIPIKFTMLKTPTWLGWDILTKAESDAIISCLRTKLETCPMTQKQKETIDVFVNCLDNSKFNLYLREIFVKRMAQVIKLRNLSNDHTKQVFGVLDCLYNEVIQQQEK